MKGMPADARALRKAVQAVPFLPVNRKDSSIEPGHLSQGCVNGLQQPFPFVLPSAWLAPFCHPMRQLAPPDGILSVLVMVTASFAAVIVDQ